MGAAMGTHMSALVAHIDFSVCVFVVVPPYAVCQPILRSIGQSARFPFDRIHMPDRRS